MRVRSNPMRARSISGVAASLVVLLTGALSMSAQSAVTVNVDALLNRHPINPNIYGVAHASTRRPERFEQSAEPQRRQQHHPLQLAAQRRQPRQRLVLREHRATAARRRASAATRSSRTRKAAGAQAMLTIPMIGWVAKLGANRSKLASFSIAKYGAADRQRLAMVCRCRQRHLPPTARIITGNDPERRECAVDSRFQQAWVQPPGRAVGPAPSGGLRYYILDNEPSLWHRTHRDVHPDRRRRWTRSRQRHRRLRRRRSRPSIPRRSGRRAGGVGLERLPLQRLRSAVWQHARLEHPARSRQRTAAGLPALAARPASPEQRRDRARGCSMCSRSTTTRRAASSATTSRRRCSCCATARRARSGIPAMWTRRGSTTAVQLIPRLKNWVNSVLSRAPQIGDHRVQLGRGEPHQRRDHAGRHLRNLRP